jgi:hypothetical protein
MLHFQAVELQEIVHCLYSEVSVLAGCVQGAQTYQLFVVIQMAFVIKENLSVEASNTNELLWSAN